MTGSFTVDEDVRATAEPGESIIWSGKPKQGLLLRRSDLFMIPFSLLWGGFAIFWEMSVLQTDAPGFFALWGIPFVLVGLYMIVGRFFIEARQRARTVYGLTNRRVIIISGLLSKTTISIPLATLSEITMSEHKDNRGSITFGRPNPFAAFSSGMNWPGMGNNASPVFELIEDAKSVHAKLLHAQRAAA